MIEHNVCSLHEKSVETMDKLLRSIEKIECALLGSFDKPDGVVQVMADLKKRIEELETAKMKIDALVWKIAGAAIFSGLLSGSIAGLLK